MKHTTKFTGATARKRVFSSFAALALAIAGAGCGDDEGGRETESGGGTYPITETEGGTESASQGTDSDSASASASQGSDSESDSATTGAATDDTVTTADVTGDTADSDTATGTASESESESDTGLGTTAGPSCTPTQRSYEINASAPSVVLVLDKSGSMMKQWDHDNDSGTDKVSRWSSVYHVTESIVGEHADTLNFGAQLFPAGDSPSNPLAQACQIDPDSPEVPVAADNAAAILAGIPGAAAEVKGTTPAAAGIGSAIDHLTDVADAGAAAMILVTDGAANCKDGTSGDDLNEVHDDTVPALVSDAFAVNGIPTYVVGIDIQDKNVAIPATNPFEAINAVAAAGGVPRDGDEKFYNVVDEIELEAAIGEITWAVECTIELEQGIDEPENVQVWLDGELVPALDSCDNGDGWVFASEDDPEYGITLCGEYCAVKQALTELEVQADCA